MQFFTRPLKNPTIDKLLLVTCLILVACGDPETNKEIQVINLDEAVDREVNLSSLIESVKVIPLETNEQYFIGSHTKIWSANDFVLVGSLQIGISESFKLYRFTLDGEFIDEIGSFGRGPGEHIGEPRNIRYYQEDQLIQVNWAGKGLDPQLFNLNGDFVQNIQVPPANSFVPGLPHVERWNDSIWFGMPLIAVGEGLPLDSIRIYFFKNDGTKVHTVPRFPEPAKPGTMSLQSAPIRYQYNGNWKFFENGEDTLFRIEDMHLIPEVIFQSENFVSAHTMDYDERHEKKIRIPAIAEGEDYWLLFRKADPGPDGNQESDIPFIFVDKNEGNVINIHLRDDVFGLFPGTYFNENWMPFLYGRKPFQDSLMHLVIHADELAGFLESSSKELDPKFQNEFDKLRNLEKEDNPVIFQFKLKDSIDKL